MKKDELQQGWIVETRSEGFYIVCGDCFVGKGWMDIESYEDDLTYDEDDSYDIIAVYKNSRKGGFGFDLNNESKDYLKVIWENSKPLPSITQTEIAILSALKTHYKYIGRDFDGKLQVSSFNPIRDKYTHMCALNHIFDGIETDETYSIQELLGANKGE